MPSQVGYQDVYLQNEDLHCCSSHVLSWADPGRACTEPCVLGIGVATETLV